ncbi:sensor histidine kinase [Fervidobacterium thailandense]|uniref:Signal transduction histidine kinase internal region domain-containing protein n=1 Tax=Fervidobacterium thailandense TaxID=1008305 RepID=A0A1E3G3C2_9BACT|nr:histidine kinase [Fervidobacterium thailandense]ODN30737.1 hypothetical protein A4H02_04200 [Fervidobacterium thailandense]
MKVGYWRRFDLLTIRLAVLQLIAFILFVLFASLIDFTNFLTPFLMSFAFVNLAYFLFVTLRKTYEGWHRFSRILWVFDVGNFIYSVFVSFATVESLLKAIAFRKISAESGLLYPPILTMISVVLALYITRLRDALEREMEARKSTESYLISLKSQLNPHFLFNVLNILAEMTRKDPKRAEDSIIKLAEYYRTVLKSPQIWTLGEEIEFLKSYMGLNRSILGELEMSWSIDVDEKLYGTPVPAMFLQPLVENAIKYGIKPCNGGYIRIEACKVNGQIILCIRNNVPSDFMVKGSITPDTGLTLTTERLRLTVGGTIDYGFESGEFKVTITLRGDGGANVRYRRR